jgi:hypothetical protein
MYDDLIVDEVRRSLHSPEADERATLHQRRVLMWGSTAVLPILFAVVGDSLDATTWIIWIGLVGALAWTWRRVSRPWIVRDEQLIQQLARASARCPRCRTIVLPSDGGQCVRCDALVNPLKMVTVAVLSCLAVMAYVVWHLGRG